MKKGNLAIKGHATRGSEVIALLEMLRGSNAFRHIGNNPHAIYYIDENYKKFITCSETKKVCDYIIFTLEEFEEKFPYKVGDKVVYKLKPNQIFTIEKAHWDGCEITYVIGNEDEVIIHTYAKELQPHKEETMEKVKDNWAKWDLPDGYEFQDKDGNIINTNVIKLVKKQSKYPKTYVECAKMIDCFSAVHIDGYKNVLLEKLQELLIYRDAYWKIAGEQMELGKPWEPDWLNVEQDKYVLFTHNNAIYSNCYLLGHNILAFPTEEMRDAFYENFKELIKQCKELL